MRIQSRSMSLRTRVLAWVSVHVLLALTTGTTLWAQDLDVGRRMSGFDGYMSKVLKAWNAPGIGVGVVVGDKLVFARGYGYRDYGRKLPFTPTTLCPIASNTKLFTVVGAGFLVDEGKLRWDDPVRASVPAVRFFNDQLNDNITLRDMLSHRTGITRHDMIWYKSDFTRRDLFDRLQYLEPKEPMRQTFLYNNMMYAGVGEIIELQSGRTWEDFLRERIFAPLEMNSTTFSIDEMRQRADFGVPFTEKRDTDELYEIPYYEDTAAMAPAGAIISNLQDMSHWMIALLNEGKYGGKQVLPAAVLKATLEPSIALPNTAAETRGFWEVLNSVYGMGRWTASYRGHLLAYHGGDINGFHSQVSLMPRERIGVIVFVIGDHCASLYNIISYNVYERLLGMDQTPWSDRLLAIRLKGKKAGTEARAKAGTEQVPNTRPSHPLADYVGEYEHPAYGILKIGMKDDSLEFNFHRIKLTLGHFHFDRFDTADDEIDGKWSITFATNPQGDVDKAVMSLDEGEAVFTRRADTLDADLLGRLAGTYETPTGSKVQVVAGADGSLYLALPGQPQEKLVHYKGLLFRLPEFSDLVLEFVVTNGQVTALKQRDPSGEYVMPRK
jgi:CubicO group peptidase (beta-lactamase class C family)